MNIAPITVSSAGAPALQAGGVKPNEAAAQFDIMFYRVLLQSVKWTSGVAGGKGAEQAIFGDMMTDFLAQAAARQQQGLGAILLSAIDQQGKGKS
jgi:Rod binding domain-containing protein